MLWHLGLRVDGSSWCLGSEGHPVAACTGFDPIVRALELFPERSHVSAKRVVV